VFPAETIPPPAATTVGATLVGAAAGPKPDDATETSANPAADALKNAWKGLRSFSMSTASGSASESSTSEVATSSASGGNKSAGAGKDSWTAWADKARQIVVDKAKEVAYDAVPQAEGSGSRSSSPDIERGEASEPSWSSWAKSAANRARAQVAEAANQVTEKAKTVEFGDGIHKEVSRGFSSVAKGASQAGSKLSEKGKAAAAAAGDLKGKGTEALKDAKAKGVENAKKAKEQAAKAAGAAKGIALKAGSNIQGLSALAMSPAKLAQFGGIFFVGIFLISSSLSFLPVLVIAPQKFALLFAFGSMTLLSSFAVLKGPKSFANSLIERKKLPFSVAYAVGLVGTLVATIIMRSFLLTAIFGVMQAVALLYFLASFVPGGQAILNLCGKCCKKSARAVGGKFMRSASAG